MPTETRIYSFDVFDTVLTRNVLYPKDVFYIVQSRIASQLPALDAQLGNCFWGVRVWSEFMMRRKTEREDITITEIYETLTQSCGLDNVLRDALMQLELEVESEVLVPVEGATKLLASCRCEGNGVVFVSDMYLPAVFIQNTLERAGLFLPGDRLYVSGELGLTKGSGNLFRYLLDDLGIKARQLIHCGDHLQSDFMVPQSIGIGQFADVATMGSNSVLYGIRSKCIYLGELLKARWLIREAKNV